MICISCGGETQSAPCALCSEEPRLDSRYQLEEVLGEGGFGCVYRATQLETSRTVAIKERIFHRAPDLKQWELFDREWRVLEQLKHSQIPAYIEHMRVGEGRRMALYIVSELIEGQTLFAELERRRFSVEEALEVVVQLLEILDYLHERSPPIIHRDIKPQNVIMNEGRAFLIDFGAVRDAIGNTLSSTVAGTFGYMAPEQFQGSASPPTDLYGVGALFVALLTREEPAVLIGGEGRLLWRTKVSISEPIADIVRRLLAPRPQARYPSARAVIEAIEEAKTGASKEIGTLAPSSALVPIERSKEVHLQLAERLVDQIWEQDRAGDDRKLIQKLEVLLLDSSLAPEARLVAHRHAKELLEWRLADRRKQLGQLTGAVMVMLGLSIPAVTYFIWGTLAFRFFGWFLAFLPIGLWTFFRGLLAEVPPQLPAGEQHPRTGE